MMFLFLRKKWNKQNIILDELILFVEPSSSYFSSTGPVFSFVSNHRFEGYITLVELEERMEVGMVGSNFRGTLSNAKKGPFNGSLGLEKGMKYIWLKYIYIYWNMFQLYGDYFIQHYKSS